MNKKELASKIRDLFIVREDDGTYNLFGKYIITPTEQGYTVTLHDLTENFNLTFCTLRNAVTWCVFDKHQKYKEVKRIHELDNILGSYDAHIVQYKRLAERSKSIESRSIYLTKLSEQKLKKRQAAMEMEDYALTSKHWQIKKFAENQAA
jgi:hypothetical protein